MSSSDEEKSEFPAWSKFLKEVFSIPGAREELRKLYSFISTPNPANFEAIDPRVKPFCPALESVGAMEEKLASFEAFCKRLEDRLSQAVFKPVASEDRDPVYTPPKKPKFFSHYATCPECGGLVNTIDTVLRGGETSLKSLLNSEVFLVHCERCENYFSVKANFFWTIEN